MRQFRVEGERLRQVDSDLYDRIINHIDSSYHIGPQASKINVIKIDETGFTLVACHSANFGCGRFFTCELIAVSRSMVRDEQINKIISDGI